MESALAWIGQIAEWIGRFIPRMTVIIPSLGAVKYTGRFRGEESMRVTAHGPGLLCYWPLVSILDLYPTVRQTDDLRSQTITTADGKTIAVSGLITYEVYDLLKLLPTTFEPAKAISEITLTAIHDALARMTWVEMTAEQQKGTLETKLRNAAKKQLDDYGVKVLRVQLTDMAPCRVLKVLQSVSADVSE
jgi:regulator of protease activity HflC (stomatin/prohibitin superfamily)